MYKHVIWQHLNQYMTSKSRGHCDKIKVFNQGKSSQIREKSGENQGIWLLKMCGHPVKINDIFLFLHENIYCGYTLEVPQWGTSNVYQQHMFLSRNKENIVLIPLLFGA